MRTSCITSTNNSWGASWGDHGYGFPYEYVLRGLAEDFWSILKKEWVDISNLNEL